MNWVLIVVIVILAFFGWYGAKKGFVKVLFSLLSTVAALLFAVLFSPMVSAYLKSNEEFTSFFEERIGTFFDAAESDESGAIKEPNKVIDVREVLSALPIPDTMKESFEKDMQKELALPTREDVREYVCKRLSDTILNAIAFVTTLAIAIIGLFVLCRVLNLLAKLPLLRQVNAACGLLSGFAEGILIVWILFVVLTMFAGEAFGQSALAMIAENPFLDYLYKSNLIAKFVMRK